MLFIGVCDFNVVLKGYVGREMCLRVPKWNAQMEYEPAALLSVGPDARFLAL